MTAYAVQEPAVAFTGLGIWRYRTETAAPPASGQLRFDNADISLATEFYLHETNDDGADVATFMGLLMTEGSTVYIQDQSDADKYVLIELGTFVDDGSYRTFQIANIIEGSGGEPSQNTKVAIIASSGAAAPAGDVFKVGTPVDNEIGVWTGDGTLEGDPNFTWDGALLDINGIVHIRGAELILEDGGGFNVHHGINNQIVMYGGGDSGATGANIQMLGGAHGSLPNNMYFRGDTDIWQFWDDTNGIWTLYTGAGALSPAIIADASQNVTVGGNLEIEGNFLTIGTDGTSAYVLASTDDQLIMYGGGISTALGANIQMLGSSRVSLSDHMYLRASTRIWQHWNETAGQWELSTGIGVKTLALTIDVNQDAIFAGDIDLSGTVDGRDVAADGIELDDHVTDLDIHLPLGTPATEHLLHGNGSQGWEEVTTTSLTDAGVMTLAGLIVTGDVTCQLGNFTSRGIDDNASAERLQISDGNIRFGSSGGSTFLLEKVSNNGLLQIQGGGSVLDGGGLWLYGSTHSGAAGDFLLTSDADTVIHWDNSAGQLDIYSGAGVLALSIDSSQDATFVGDVNVDGNVQVDNDVNVDGFIDVAEHIGFPAVQVASAGANDLDDYEEGTWTPTVIAGGKTLNNIVLATYTKVGRMVNCFMYINLTGTGTTAAFATGGLPFAAALSFFGSSIVDFGFGGRKGAMGRVNSFGTTMSYIYSSENPAILRPAILGNQLGSSYCIVHFRYQVL